MARWESDDAGWIEVSQRDGSEFEVKDHTGRIVACQGLFAALEVAHTWRAELYGIMS